MTTQEAIAALRPLTSQFPSEALDHIRAHWPDAEPSLLEAIEAQLAGPGLHGEDGLFVYAIHLCAEMRSTDVFPLFIRIARLPRLLLDQVMGDMLTETFEQMLARTCHGRIDEIKGLIEDPTLAEYARSAALDALLVLVVDGEFEQGELGSYCEELLRSRLEQESSNVWDAAIGICCHLKVPGVLPLIEGAIEVGLSASYGADIKWVHKQYQRAGDVTPAELRKVVRPFLSSEAAMGFFVSSWGREEPDRDEKLLEVLQKRRKTAGVVGRNNAKVGRNAPCPCGSGKKYKKCCINEVTALATAVTVRDTPIREEHAVANDWMEAGYYYAKDDSRMYAIECWQRCWGELEAILPDSLRDPSLAEETGAFEGYDCLANWLQDFEGLLTPASEHSFATADYALEFFETVVAMFPDLNPNIYENMKASEARLLAMMGDWDEGIDVLKELIKQRPKSPKGYVELADFYGFEAERLFNRSPDLKEAETYLRMALERAEDCEGFDVELRLADILEMGRSVGGRSEGRSGSEILSAREV